MKKKILVLTDTLPWGHRSIAKAIYGYLKTKEKENNWQVDYAEVKADTGIGGDLYTLAYRYLPASNMLAHKLMLNEQLREVVAKLSDINLPNLQKTVNRFKPDLVICCYFYHSHSLAGWKKKDARANFKLWTVVADPWTINPVSYVEGADLHLVYDDYAVRQGVLIGIEKEKILKTGWWVRPQMYEKHNREEMRKKLGLIDGRPLVFVGGGSLGTYSLTRLLPVLMMVKKPVGVIFNTGTDKMAYNLVEEYIRIFKRLRRNDLVWIKNMGWIDNMAEVLSACDIVFGKAGPNFLFDVVAVGKPLVAITHIGGQEDGNIDLIKKKHLGWVREKGTEMTDMFLEFLDNPEMVKKLEKPIQEEARNNQRTMRVVEKRIKEELG
ncbi:MAG: glycosyltransferase [Candidatus Shapirobacteria bacterium]|nr:glycosyltransferase [Candidatus Shapirobacteria bacterium]